LHKQRSDAPELTITLTNGPEEIGLFVAVISSLYIRLRYSKHLALVKNPFAVYRGHPYRAGALFIRYAKRWPRFFPCSLVSLLQLSLKPPIVPDFLSLRLDQF